MKCRSTRRQVGDFTIHTLSNSQVAVSVAPQLGGRVVSIRDRISGREWLDGWHPASKRRLWHPTDPADFTSGPGAGIDECLPTVRACTWNGKPLPDHGELWHSRPEFLADSTAAMMTCKWQLVTLPLVFSRRILLVKNEIVFHYSIKNRSDKATPFLWAWHALFTWKPGDRMIFPTGTNHCLTPEGSRLPWPETQPGCDLSIAQFKNGITPAAKVFIGPSDEGRAEIRAQNGASISLSWPAAMFPYAGVWITRGFWKNLHHWAIEPTNAPVDGLSDISPQTTLTQLAPEEIREWTLRVTPCHI